MATKLLIIDDEELFREDLADLLRSRNYACVTASNGEEGLDALASFEPDVVLCDIVMEGKSGLELLDDITRSSPETSVIMVTAYGSLQTAVEAFRKGAADYIIKPLVIEDAIQKVDRLVKYKRMRRELTLMRRQLSSDIASLSMVGQSEAMKKVLDQAEKVALTNSTVLITGASGTGKELVARAIHNMSTSNNDSLEVGGETSPFVAINCAGIPGELLESELFGHVKGAFTGAVQDRVGHFEAAQDGTILLDEVAEMPLALQGKLLRVLEQREFVRVGGSKTIPLPARFIAATNKNLRDLVAKGEFREDLFFRLAVFEMALPSLRERRSDIPLLIEYFISKLNHDMKCRCLGPDRDAMRCLIAHSWPGNVRELRNALERAMILARDGYLTPAQLPHELQDASSPKSSSDDLREAMRAYEAAHILRVLRAANGNKEETARRLGVNPSTLYRKMTDLGIQDEGTRQSAR